MDKAKHLMELEISESISLQALTQFHAKELLETVNTSRDDLSVYMPWTDTLTDMAGARSYINARKKGKLYGSQWFAIYYDGAFSGVFGIKYIDPVTKVSELGYWLSTAVRGHRIINQVLNVILPYLSSSTTVDTVEFHCLESNEASIRVVERAGAKLVKYVGNNMDIPNKDQRLGIYALKL
ncbi:GNAT family N-acetyltransferase [Photobacterium proteolyticum]|nr:GNAT family N-acetyltransferase [Photobacterium proteolyticum]